MRRYEFHVPGWIILQFIIWFLVLGLLGSILWTAGTAMLDVYQFNTRVKECREAGGFYVSDTPPTCQNLNDLKRELQQQRKASSNKRSMA